MITVAAAAAAGTATVVSGASAAAAPADDGTANAAAAAAVMGPNIIPSSAEASDNTSNMLVSATPTQPIRFCIGLQVLPLSQACFLRRMMSALAECSWLVPSPAVTLLP